MCQQKKHQNTFKRASQLQPYFYGINIEFTFDIIATKLISLLHRRVMRKYSRRRPILGFSLLAVNQP